MLPVAESLFLRSHISQLIVSLRDFGQVDVQRTGRHTFELASFGLWIGMGEKHKVEVCTSSHQGIL